MTSESHVQSQIRLAAAESRRCILWRNNSGSLQDAKGRWVRFGLANDSKAVNAQYKSPDLVGITRVVVTQDMVGRTLGVFTGIECKAPGWSMDERARAQDRFNHMIRSWSGRAGFASSVDEAQSIWT